MTATPLEFISKAQEDFFMAAPGGVLGLYGGFGAGKTHVMCMKALWILDTFPGCQGAIIRRTSKHLRKSTLKTFLEVLPPEHTSRFNEQDGVMEFRNGSRLFLIHLDDEKSIGVLKSLELTFACVDQAEELDASHVDLLVRRVGRWSGATVPDEFLTDSWAWSDGRGRPMPPSWVMLVFNAPGFDSYLWQRLADESPDREKWRKRGWRLLRTSSRDNKALGKANLAELLAADDDFIAQYVDATAWGITKGMVFTISPDSLIPASAELLDRIKRTMKLHRSLDHGETAPTCCLWWAVDHDGNIFCVAPETKILTADLKHVPAGSLKVGDELVGFDEHAPTGKQRRYRKSIVESVSIVRKPSYRLHLEDGTSVTCSTDHLWLVPPRSADRSNPRWVRTDHLATDEDPNPSGRRGPKSTDGDSLLRITDVWATEDSYGAGYLAGALDGEGSLSRRQPGGYSLSIGQKDNQLLARVKSELDSRDVRYVTSMPAGYEYVFANISINRQTDVMRVAGSVRPARLLPKFDPDNLGSLRTKKIVRVLRKEYVGEVDVVAIQTSTRTYIAEGLASHNCYREYYAADPMVSTHRRNIVELSREDRARYSSNLADPSIFFKTRGHSMTGNAPKWAISFEYADTKLLDKDTAIHWTPAENDEEATRSRVREYLRVDPNHRHPVTGRKGAPHLYFVQKSVEHPWGCEKVISETRAQRYKQIGESSDGTQLFSEERDDQVVDHAYDALKYGVSSRPSLGLAPARPEAGPNDIYLDQYFAADEAIKRGRRRQERMLGVSKAGYG